MFIVIELSFSAKVAQKRRQKLQHCVSSAKRPLQILGIEKQFIVEEGE